MLLLSFKEGIHQEAFADAVEIRGRAVCKHGIVVGPNCLWIMELESLIVQIGNTHARSESLLRTYRCCSLQNQCEYAFPMDRVFPL